MKYKLIDNLNLPPVLIGRCISQPYIFSRKIKDTPTTYIVLFHQKEPLLFTCDLDIPETFLEHFLEMYLPEKQVGTITVIRSAPDYLKEYSGTMYKPFTLINENKFKVKKSLLHKILMRIEVFLQILTKERSKQLAREELFCNNNAKIGYWTLFFKKLKSPTKEWLEGLISQIPN
ncbi:hypothetical protein ABLT89_14350 [Acinetobacter schindleri]|uniref:hypothetical protein n=1 Tax=Acinetobacter schindleri TaxID=108981 RepID=UPI0032B49DAB